MGVDGLWSLVNPVGKQVNLECCKGKRIAVDLSAWVVQCSTVARNIPTAFICCRGLFMRTLNLLSLGISLVFVIDGPSAPAIKKKVKNREVFYREVMEFKELLTALGLPVLECVGEAEKMCAQLNHLNLVDGVLTNDGDALIYGAQTVYKGLFQDSKNLTATEYNMADVTANLNLTRRDLIAFALLSAGDFSDGVPNVRDKKFAELIKEFKKNNIEDALDRFLSWSSNSELDSLDNKKQSLIGIKKKHCTKCSHEGTKQGHNKSGCTCCQVDFDCNESSSPGHPPCSCEYHVLEETVKAYKTELKLRELALKSNANFPDQAIIAEFLGPLPIELTSVNLSLNIPDFKTVCRVLKKKLHFSDANTMSFLVPATIKMAFHGLLPDLTIRPMCIIRACKYKFEQCFLVRWQKFDQDEFSDDESFYEIKFSQEVFTLKYPEIVDQFEGTSTHAVKQNSAKLAQSKMTSYFNTVKLDKPHK
uniref:XPG-I domain-containing protein n=1 Tax=Arion vulgaris TaxID=1028688 RepID=A0A0B7A9K8_9EUPU